MKRVPSCTASAPMARKRARCSRGPPCEATITGMRASQAMSRSSLARGLFNGMFTPNGFAVLLLISRRAFSKSCGRIGPAAITPIPPAFDTATINGAFDDAQLIAAWKIGCSMPRSSVMRVLISTFFALDELACLSGKLRQDGFKNLSFLRRQASVEGLVAFGGRADQPLVEPPSGLAEREL